MGGCRRDGRHWDTSSAIHLTRIALRVMLGHGSTLTGCVDTAVLWDAASGRNAAPLSVQRGCVKQAHTGSPLL